MMNDAVARPSCPCCFLPDDLFLPPSTVDDDDGKNSEPKTAVSLNETDDDDVVRTPTQAWKELQLELGRQQQQQPLLLVDTHGHGHLERANDNDKESASSSSIYHLNEDDASIVVPSTQSSSFVSLTCAVEPKDWHICLEYASASPSRIAALGVHPWYLNDLPDTWLSDLEALLQAHPYTAVGEVGLCKMARFVRTYEQGKQAALALQRHVLEQQLCLAAKYKRPVSIHCVKQQGILLELLQELEQLPPAMAMHSFSGTAHQVQQLLAWEETRNLPLPLLYFGFSHAVNHAMVRPGSKAQRQGRAAVCAVPVDRLLAESDVHADADVVGGTVGALAYIAWARQESLEHVAKQTTRNALNFLRRLLPTQQGDTTV